MANDDTYSTLEDTALNVPAPGPLGNDTDPEGDSLTLSVKSQPLHGTLNASADGQFTYTPNAGYSGPDSFTYAANDSDLDSNTATVNISVKPVNRPPVANNDAYSTQQDIALKISAPGILINDNDPEGSPLTAIIVTQPSNGVLIATADGFFTYTPNSGYTGSDTFTYLANDGNLNSNTATVQITVSPPPNQPPVANNDSYSMPQDTALNVGASGILANDLDPEGHPLTASIESQPSNGTLTAAADGQFTYTPNAGYTGPDSFTYRANDGDLDSAVATVSITVNFVNKPPVANDDIYSMPQYTVLNIAVAGVLINDSDPEGHALTVIKESDPTNGTLSINPDGSFSYTPNTGFIGTDSFTYKASDSDLESAIATVTITVNFVNKPPVANDDAYSTPQDTPLYVRAPGFLANDSDPEGHKLTFTITGQPLNGHLYLLSGGGFSYIPFPGFTGPDLFTYKAYDGDLESALTIVNITVDAVNQPPVANNDSYSMPQDTVLNITAPGVLVNDSDPENHALTMIKESDPTNGTLSINPDGSFSYTPTIGFSGTDSFTYKASDSDLESAIATVTITVNFVNKPPVANNDSYSMPQDTVLNITAPGVLINDSDPENHALSMIKESDPTNGTLSINPDGSFSYTPTIGFTGTDSFTYKASDSDLESGVATVTITVNFVNKPPVANNDSYSMPQDTVLNITAPGVLVNDSDPENHALTVIKESDPANGILAINPDGSFSYTPTIGFSGTDTFTYKASDSDLESGVATVTITVNFVNKPPVANNDSYSMPQDTVLNITAPGVLVNDSDPENHALTMIKESDPTNGTLSINPDGSFSYTPTIGFTGTDSFTYKASDSDLESGVATVTITVNFVNKPPVANNDSYSMPQDTVLNITAPGVLINDSDPEGHALTVIKESDPTNGILLINPDGSFSYVPKTGFSGTDSFTYKTSDSDLESSVATVTITVNFVNKPPVAKDDFYTTPQDVTLVIAGPGILLNDSDPEGHSLGFTITTLPAHGTLTMAQDGGFNYVPDPGYSGIDGFSYTVNDGQLDSVIRATAQITVNFVNKPPVANDDSYSMPQDTVLNITAPGVLFNDSDPEGHVLTMIKVSDPTNGILLINPDGSFSYLPKTGFSGTDSFTYKTSDSDLESGIATVTITVNFVNKPPVANDDSYSMPQDTVLNITAPGVLFNDSDPEGHALTMIKESDPANGTLSINPDGSFSYTPTIGFSGTDSFTYKASDSDLESGVATVTITVNFVNKPPVANDDSYSMPQDTTLDIAPPGILVNDSDPEGHALTISVLIQPANGHLSVALDGGISYTPDAGYTGLDTFTYIVNDGLADSNPATVQITVSAVNQPPVANDDAYSMPQDTVLNTATPGVLFNDSDPEGHVLTMIKVSDPASGTLSINPDGSFSYTPNAGFSGTDSFTYKVSDSDLESGIATVTITVNFVNKPPVANDDSYSMPQDTVLNTATPGALINDSDPEGHALTMIKVSDPASGTLAINPDGSFSYTPNAGFTGTDSFTYKASDSDLESGIATVTITVSAVNQPPVANDDAYSMPQDTVLNTATPGALINDSDPEGHALTMIKVSDPASGALSINPDGSFSYTPNAGFSGTDSFTYKASDSDLESGIATVTITVSAVNQPPVANNDAYSMPQDTVLNTATPGALINDSDPEGHALTMIKVSDPASGTLAINPDGSFSYTPNAGFSGTDSFTYKASDSDLESGIATVTITVSAVNQPPVANNDAYSMPQDTVLNIATPGILVNDSDPEGHALTINVLTQPTNGLLSVALDGGITYTPNAGYTGLDTFTYSVNDGQADSNAATVQITVSAVNQPPVANNDSYSVPQDTVLYIAPAGVLVNDSDPEGHALTVIKESDPASGTLAINPDGSFSYTPNAGFSGTDSFTYKGSDSDLESAIATVTITVNAVNQPPVANNDAYSMPQDTVLNIATPGILLNDSDPEGHALSINVLTQPANGHLSAGLDGSFSYTPDAGYTGLDTFTYSVNDGQADSNQATVQITVNAVNQPPVASNDAYSTPQDTVMNITAPGILVNDSDPEGHALSISVLTQPANGHLSVALDGSFSYTPDAGYTGLDTFTYSVNDGQADSNVATVQITVNAVNQPPVANNDAYSMPQDTVLNIATPGILVNDSDPEGHALTVIKESDPVSGTLSINPDGSFSYTPNAGFSGTDSFTYKASDSDLESGIATVTITVSAVNQPPVANNDSYSMPMDTVLNIAAPGILLNDSDPEGHALGINVLTQPANGHLSAGLDGSFSYTPNAGYSGLDTFTYSVSDGQADSNVATVQITVNAVNQPPVASNDVYSTPQDTVLNIAAPGILLNDSDPEGHALSVSVLTQPANGHLSVALDGSFSYTPDAAFSGTDAFTYLVNDGSLDSNTATVEITVNAVNLPPVAVDDSYSTPQDTVLNIAAAGVLTNDSDPEGHALTMIKVSDPASGTLSINPDGSFSYTPNAGFSGTDSFTYKASDSDLESGVATVTITVNAVNLPPVAVDDAYSVLQDTVLTVIAPGVLGNDSDPEGHNLNLIVLTQPANGHLAIALDGSFSYTPDAGFTGIDSFTYKVNDGAADSNTAVVSIEVLTASAVTTRFATSIDFPDGNTASVTATLTCSAGTPLTQSFDIADGSPFEFTIMDLPFTTPGTNCEITVSGLSAAYTLSPQSCVFDADAGTFAPDGNNVCAFVAGGAAANYTVEKFWVIDEQNAVEDSYIVDVTVTCDSDILAIDGIDYIGGTEAMVSLDDGESALLSIDTSNGITRCSAVEEFAINGVEQEASAGCTNAAMGPGESARCTFTNTVFFRGIPSLSEYGMAIMALLMLCLGFFTIRRWA